MLITKQSAAAIWLSAGSPVCVLFKAAAVYMVRCGGGHRMTVNTAERLYGMSFRLSCMKRGEPCHHRCIGLLLTGYMQGIGAAKPNAGGARTGLGLKSGVW